LVPRHSEFKLDLQYKCLEEPSGVFASLEHLSLNSMLGSDSENALKKLDIQCLYLPVTIVLC
jgi:hypothetical protein